MKGRRILSNGTSLLKINFFFFPLCDVFHLSPALQADSLLLSFRGSPYYYVLCTNILIFCYLWGQEEKGTTEDEMAGWHHWLDGRESQWTPGVGVGQGGLACCDSWGRKELDTTERLILSDLIWIMLYHNSYIYSLNSWRNLHLCKNFLFRTPKNFY